MVFDLENYGHTNKITKYLSVTPACSGATMEIVAGNNAFDIYIYYSSGKKIIRCHESEMTREQIYTLFRHIDLAATYPEHELLARFPEEFL